MLRYILLILHSLKGRFIFAATIPFLRTSDLIFCNSNEYLVDCGSGKYSCSFCDCNEYLEKQMTIDSDRKIILQILIIKIANITEFIQYIKMVDKIQLQTRYKSTYQFIFILSPFVANNMEEFSKKLQDMFTADTSKTVFFDMNHTPPCSGCKIGNIFLQYYEIGDFKVWNTVESVTQSMLLRQRNFRGMQIKVVAQFDPDYLAELNMEIINGSIHFLGGSSFYILNDLKDIFNFTIDPIIGKGWITQNPNGTLTGIGGQVFSGEAELSIAQSTMAFYRAAYLAFIQPVTANRYHAAFRQPLAYESSDILFSAFDGDVWIAIAVLWIIVTVLIVLITLFKYLQLQQIDSEVIDKSEVFLGTIGILCQQDWHSNINERAVTSEKMVIIIFFLASVFFYAFFSSKIISSLSVVIVPITNFDGLLKYNYIILSRPSLPLFTSVVKSEEVAAKLIELAKLNYINEDTSIRKIVDGDKDSSEEQVAYAFVSFISTFFTIGRKLNYSDVELCSLSTLPIGTVRFKNAMFVKKYSAYLEFFNYGTIKIINSGLNSRYYRTFSSETNALCDYNSRRESHARQLTYLDFQSSYFIILLGFSLAFVIIISEIIIFRVQNSISYSRKCKVKTSVDAQIFVTYYGRLN